MTALLPALTCIQFKAAAELSTLKDRKTGTTSEGQALHVCRRGGFIVYRAHLDNGTLTAAGAANTLDLGKAPHDYAHVSMASFPSNSRSSR